MNGMSITSKSLRHLACDPANPGATTIIKGIVAGNGCRPESALLLLFGLKRLWPELVHAEHEDARPYDLVFTSPSPLELLTLWGAGLMLHALLASSVDEA